MTEQIGSLLGFSKGREALQLVYASAEEVIERAIQTLQARPQFRGLVISFLTRVNAMAGSIPANWIGSYNLLLNVCEAVRPDSGRITVHGRRTTQGLEIRVADSGAGIPEVIRENLFEPFISYGKENAIGLTVVQKIM